MAGSQPEIPAHPVLDEVALALAAAEQAAQQRALEERGIAPCPCGSRASYDECCGPLHLGQPAPTAERLMRSRFSAFVFNMPGYLLWSWDASTRPATLQLEQRVEWKRLFISDTTAGGPNDSHGFVTFTAIGRGPEGRFEQRERSSFTRAADGHWRYLDGEEQE